MGQHDPGADPRDRPVAGGPQAVTAPRSRDTRTHAHVAHLHATGPGGMDPGPQALQVVVRGTALGRLPTPQAHGHTGHGTTEALVPDTGATQPVQGAGGRWGSWATGGGPGTRLAPGASGPVPAHVSLPFPTKIRARGAKPIGVFGMVYQRLPLSGSGFEPTARRLYQILPPRRRRLDQT